MEYFSFILIISLFAIANIAIKTKKKEQVALYYMFCFVIALAIGMKGVGMEYDRVFRYIPELDVFFSGVDRVAIEKGYVFALICSIIKTLGGGVQTVYVVFSFLSVFIHGIFYRKFTEYYFLALVIYLAHEIISKEWIIMRAGLSSALLLPMIWYLTINKKGKFWLLVVVSGLIQYVGFTSVAIRWLNRKISCNYLLAGLTISVAISYSGTVSKLLWFIKDNKLLPFIITQYVGYEAYSYDIGLLHAKAFEQIVVTFFAIMLIRKMPSHPSPYFNLIFNSYYFGTICFILFKELAIFATRINGHFYVVEPLLLIYLARYFKEKRAFLAAVLCGAVMLSYVNYVLTNKLDSYQIYTEFWD